jgi:hypothetical protein
MGNEGADEQEPKSFSIAVFPFLRTTDAVEIGGVIFRSTDDVGGLGSEEARCVVEIAEMLFLQDDLRIRQASYCLVPFIDLEHTDAGLDRLRRIRTVVAYCYAIPHHIFGDPHLRYEHASLVVFSPGRVWAGAVSADHNVEPLPTSRTLLPDARGEIDGYHGLYNFRHHFWVTKGSRVYPPIPHLVLNIAQDLTPDLYDFSRSPRFERLSDLIMHEPLNGMTERALTSISWFNEANSLVAGDEAAIVSLAIAFESLLGLPEDQKSKRLVDSVSLLLGRVPRLSEWADQFYRARSETVHEGRATELRFRAAESAKAASGSLYNSLLAYGRPVFQLCVATLLFGDSMAQRAGLEEKFVTNRERFEQISRSLSDESAAIRERFRAISARVDAIQRYRFVGESSFPIRVVLDAMRLAAKAILACEEELGPELRAATERLATTVQSADSYEALDALREFHDVERLNTLPGDPFSPRFVTFRLAEASWGYVFWNYYSLREKREEQASDDERPSPASN